ncbi:MAG: AcvB/VirJ family lysyl-phosphatidylglycerol hydrolase [bacterium]
MRPRVSSRTARALGCLAAAAVVIATPLAAQLPASGVGDLPVVEVRATGHTGTLAIFLSGDGGWADIDRQIGGVLAERGIDVIGFDDKAYLRGTHRDADGTARDVARVASFYLSSWSDHRLVLIGYSRGADLLPFVVTRLPSALRSQLALVAMLAVQERASFTYRFSDLWATRSRVTDIPIRPELERLRGVNMVCVYGEDESESLCRGVDSTLVRPMKRPGKHHFDGDYRAIAAWLVAQLDAGLARSPR